MAYNPYYNNNFIPQQSNYANQYMMNPMQMQQPIQQNIQRQEQYQNIGLQGKSVDSIDVVKAMDITLDGSISYFPLTDGSAIVTKQLQNDGTSKIVIYKPTTEKETIENAPKYITSEELEEKIKKLNNSDIKDELKSIKKQIREIVKDIEEINEDRKD